MQVALATCAFLPEGWPDDEPLIATLRERGAETRFVVWDDPVVEWERFDLVLIRSTWDYTDRRDEFVAWAERVGERLHNPPRLVRWNSDKRYLADLAEAGLPVVPTAVVAPGDPLPPLEGEVVVKPAVSAGARDTGRFGPAAHDQARALLESLLAGGEAAMVQPYVEAVDERGETAIVYFGGRPSHALRKRAVLRPDEVAPMREDHLSVAEVMLDPGLVSAAEAGAEELAAAERVLAEVARRFGAAPLYARVDLVPGPGGSPLLIELEAIEPSFYFDLVPEAAARLAAAVIAAAG